MRNIIIFCLMILLSGCASFASLSSSVRYQLVESISGGYATYRVSDELYQVYYTTNPQWNKITAEEYSKKITTYQRVRAAILTLEQGYDFFVIINSSSANDRGLDESNAANNLVGWGMVHFLTIRLGKGKLQSGAADIKGVGRAFDARLFLNIMKTLNEVQEYFQRQQKTGKK